MLTNVLKNIFCASLAVVVLVAFAPHEAAAQNISTTKFGSKRGDVAPHANVPGFGSSFFKEETAEKVPDVKPAKPKKPRVKKPSKPTAPVAPNANLKDGSNMRAQTPRPANMLPAVMPLFGLGDAVDAHSEALNPAELPPEAEAAETAEIAPASAKPYKRRWDDMSASEREDIRMQLKKRHDISN